jgi:hypothetical protein
MKGHLRKRGRTRGRSRSTSARPPRKAEIQMAHRPGGKRKAQDECTRLLNELATGEYVERQKMTVREYLAYWLENYAKLNVAGRTFERYSEIVRLHRSRPRRQAADETSAALYSGVLRGSLAKRAKGQACRGAVRSDRCSPPPGATRGAATGGSLETVGSEPSRCRGSPESRAPRNASSGRAPNEAPAGRRCGHSAVHPSVDT